MLSRRAFVTAGAALATLATAPARALQSLPHRSTGAPPLRVIFDRALREGRAFGVAAGLRGARVDAVGADLASFWMSTLEPELKRGPATLAGLTAGAPLFCLELLCRDYGLGTVYRMEHSIAPNGRVEHALIGDSSLADWPGRLAASGRAWAAEAAVLATSGATLPRPATALELLDLADGRASRSSFTWVIQSDVGAASAAILKSRD